MDKESGEYKVLMKFMSNKWGETISILKLYKLFSDTFIRKNTSLILESHKEIKSYIEDKDEWISTDVILYHERLQKWCKEYGVVFDYMKKVIPTILRIQKNITKKIGAEELYVEGEKIDPEVIIKEDPEKLYDLINMIFTKVYRKNRAGFIPEVKQYVLLETQEYIGIPRTSLLDYSTRPTIIGYTGINYVEKRPPMKGYQAIVSCPYAITWKE
jgi:hypothetical protein